MVLDTIYIFIVNGQRFRSLALRRSGSPCMAWPSQAMMCWRTSSSERSPLSTCFRQCRRRFRKERMFEPRTSRRPPSAIADEGQARTHADDRGLIGMEAQPPARQIVDDLCARLRQTRAVMVQKHKIVAIADIAAFLEEGGKKAARRAPVRAGALPDHVRSGHIARPILSG